MYRLVIVALYLSLFAGSLVAQSRPNFVFILTDDQSYGYLGCTGNETVQTPNIDRLAKDGILFDNAHVTSAICTPSRISILLSQHERRHNVNFNSGTSVAPEAWANSYPVVMRQAGYYTGWIGKNHAPIGEGGYGSGLMEKSFDYWYAGHGHLGFYPKERHKIFKNAKVDTQLEIVSEGIDDFLMTNERKLEGALHFLDARPKDQPFLLSINLNLPHGAGTRSMQMRDTDDEIYRTLYRDQDIPLPAYYVAKQDIDQPKLPANLLRAEDRQAGYDYVDSPETNREQLIREYQAMTGIDRLVGNLRAALTKAGLAKNTVLIFTSDHGLFHGEQGLGGKALCYEETTHVPLIIFDPEQPKRKRGKRSIALVQSIDIAPTILTRAGVPLPASFQGEDLGPLLAGKQEAVREYLFTENLWSTKFGNPRCEAVQNKEWKYIRYYRNSTFPASKLISTAKELGINPNLMLYPVHDPGIAVYRDYVESPLRGEQPVYEELYHLAEDPGEIHNLIDAPEHANVLQTLRAAWKREITRARGEGLPLILRYTADNGAVPG
ncbi:sulfatase-like hydrolase/transferase [Neolewinella aurantiaca]|uniref:Sulfatase-like hydrolase/transferase n=1 Tax=Neolewinella aurantiaca TaxID=2602767 RepID=A0A5C7FXH7_9BACT|nr:sulfatase-like hydrolase/transferase [Neolewinella aurantiaca]TXF90219.1 sulfatase-like hydrolase/transferase [Neolewinella aurantiaca]